MRTTIDKFVDYCEPGAWNYFLRDAGYRSIRIVSNNMTLLRI
jgi:hypothetical protein